MTQDPSDYASFYDPFGEEDRQAEIEAKRQREEDESKWVPRRRDQINDEE